MLEHVTDEFVHEMSDLAGSKESVSNLSKLDRPLLNELYALNNYGTNGYTDTSWEMLADKSQMISEDELVGELSVTLSRRNLSNGMVRLRRVYGWDQV